MVFNELDKNVMILKEVINKVNSDKVNLKVNSTKIPEDKCSYIIAEISGGLNGNGRWEDYFEVLSKLCKEARDNYGTKIWLIELKNDCLDDIFYATIGVRVLKRNQIN